MLLNATSLLRYKIFNTYSIKEDTLEYPNMSGPQNSMPFLKYRLEEYFCYSVTYL